MEAKRAESVVKEEVVNCGLRSNEKDSPLVREQKKGEVAGRR